MGSHYVPAIHDLDHAETIGMEEQPLHPVCPGDGRAVRPRAALLQEGHPEPRSARPDMNSLVVLGTSAAWGYSVVSTFAPAALPSGTRLCLL
jgi:Cu+-exporting ATPase